MTPQELTICEFNLENLFLALEYYKGQDLERVSEDEWRRFAVTQLQKRQKPIYKVWGLSKAILDIDPDIVMASEVGGVDSLENFSKYFLEDKYTPIFVDGNSSRAIDLGFLVKKNLNFRVEAVSNKETPIEITDSQGSRTARFSRDIAELRIYDGVNALKLIVLLVHLKSKITTENDIKGKNVRKAEAIALAHFYEKLREQYPDTPLVVGGDFNADLSSIEFEVLTKTDLINFHDILQTPPEGRTTYVHFDYGGEPDHQVIDYILVSPHLSNRLVTSKSYTYRYKEYYGVPEMLPKTLKKRYQLPSDHYPLVLTVLI